MKALTLYQPWASLIAWGFKTMETRSWRPPYAFNFGDRIAIHAAASKPFGLEPKSKGKEQKIETHAKDLWLPLQDTLGIDLPLGAVVATARLVEAKMVVQSEDENGVVLVSYDRNQMFVDSVQTDPYGDFTEGRWLWFLKDIVQVEPPVKVRGFQKLWTLPEEVANLLTTNT